MRKLIGVIALCLLTFPALCQSTSKYQVGVDYRRQAASGLRATVQLSPPAMTFPSKWATQFTWYCTRNRWANSLRSTQPGTNC